MKLIEAIIMIILVSLTATVCIPVLNASIKSHRESAERISRTARIRETIASFEASCSARSIPAAPEGCSVRTLDDGDGSVTAILVFEMAGNKFELYSEVSHEDGNP
jgi:type II secretory pathway component PulJ